MAVKHCKISTISKEKGDCMYHAKLSLFTVVGDIDHGDAITVYGADVDEVVARAMVIRDAFNAKGFSDD